MTRRPKRAKIADDRVTASDVLAFISQTCRIPEGPRVGQPVKLADFQVEFIRAVYDNPDGPTRASRSPGSPLISLMIQVAVRAQEGNPPA